MDTETVSIDCYGYGIRSLDYESITFSKSPLAVRRRTRLGTVAQTQSHLGVLCGRVVSILMLVLVTRVRVVDATTLNRDVGHTFHSDPHVLYASPLAVPDQALRCGLNRI